MSIANTDQRVDIKKYDQNFDRIFGKKAPGVATLDGDLALATKMCVESCQGEGEDFEDVTILVLSNNRVLFEGKYQSCSISQSRAVVPDRIVGSLDILSQHVEPGSEVLTITARGKV